MTRSNGISLRFLMLVVALAALDAWALRVAYVDPKIRVSHETIGSVNTRYELMARGALPMANLVAIRLLIGIWRRRIDRSVVGFVTFGIVALASFVAFGLFWFSRHYPYIRFVNYISNTNFVRETFGTQRVPLQVVISIVLVTPQLVVAVAGGMLGRWCWRPTLSRVDLASSNLPQRAGGRRVASGV